jgi:type I restriction enzyme S subunit
MPSLNQQVVERIPIALPGLDEQRLIASTLSALDDKIELNRRTNEALEAMARSLFKSWFVDFDPVTAKAAGKKPFGMTDDLAALFPSEFTDSDQGPIPKGWRLERLDALCNFLSGGTPFKGNADYWGGSIPWVTAKDLKVQRLHDSELHITAKGLEAGSNMAPAGATLILVRGMSLHQEIRIGFCCRDVSFNQDVKAVSPKSPSLSSFVFLGIENVIADLLGMVDAASHGTGRLNTERLRSLQFAMPTPNLLPAFDAKVRHILDRLKANDVESMSLSMTRDLLLPKLLSGEIRLRDAERKIKEVV